MNILLTGATGLLGSYVVRSWRGSGNLLGIYKGNYNVPDDRNVRYLSVDVRDREKLQRIFEKYPIDVVLHAAGEARVDFCEKNYELAYSANVTGTENIAGMCRAHKSKMVYISTNAVFDGTKPLYREEDEPNPMNSYGRIKLECEKLVGGSFDDFLIVRPILMFGWNRPQERENVATWILRKLRQGEQIKLVDDIYDNPLYALQSAECIIKLVEKNKKGVYHIGGGDVVNRYQFGLAMAEVFDLDRDLIKPVKNAYFEEIAPRPKDTSYDTQKIRRELGIKPMGVREALGEMAKEMNYAFEKTAL